MSILNIRPILTAGAVSKNSDVQDCAGIEQLFLVVKVDETVALAGTTITLLAPFDQNSDLSTAPVIAGAVATNPDAGGFAFVSGTGILTANATTSGYFTIRVPFPPRYVAVKYAYGSGGGTLAVNVFAYGNSYGPL